MRLTDIEDLDLWEWPDGAVDAVASALEGADPAERALAVALADQCFAEERVVQALIGVVERPGEAEVRAAAAIALGPMLESCELELNDYDEEVSQATFERARKALEAAWRDAGNPEIVRRRALEAAVRAPLPWQEAAIREAVASPAAAWRMTGVFGAGHVQGLQELVLAALDDADLEVRVEAVRALGTLGDAAPTQRLVRLLRKAGTPPEIRLACVGALEGIGTKEAAAALQDVADSDDDEEIAEAAREALEEGLFGLDLDDED